MFLLKVYRHSKWMFAGMLFFIAMQVLVTWKRGMVFTPWYNFGMYSSVILPKPAYDVVVVMSGKDTLKGHHYSPAHWDRIAYTAMRMAEWQCRENFYQKEVTRLFTKTRLLTPDRKHFISLPGEQNLMPWYSNWIQQYFGLPFMVRLEQWHCQWNGTTLIPVSKNEHFQSDVQACR